MLEPAIPQHLRRERTCPVKMPADHKPAYPVYMARFPQTAKDLVMAVIGAQFPSQTTNGGAETAIRKLTSFTTRGPNNKDAPVFSELASITDGHGFYNITVFAYWPDRAAYNAWSKSSGFEAWWSNIDIASSSHGWFREVFFPDHEHFESMFNHPDLLEGAAHMRECSSGPIQEHVYWGSMRDRIAAAQTDPLSREEPAKLHKATQPKTVTGRVSVPGRQNLCVIRSGQDWASTRPAERELYLNEMEPTLRKGMNFLRDQGEEVGCYSNRFMDIVDSDPASLAANKDRTFGLGYFDDMASLEYWSREHPTHKAIFGGFLQYNMKLNNDTSLLVFHEVFVVKKDQQLFEYINCHENTGMLTSVDGLKSVSTPEATSLLNEKTNSVVVSEAVA